MAATEVKHNFLTVEYHSRRRGSETLPKPVKKLLSGLRAHKSSEELHKVGQSSTPRADRRRSDFTPFTKNIVPYAKSDGSPSLRKHGKNHSVGGSSDHGSGSVPQGAAPIIQVQTASPTLERHGGRPNMKKSLADVKGTKRRKSPLSKRSHGDVGVSGMSSRPTRTTGAIATDGALLSDGPQSLDESETAESSASATLISMATNGGSASDATGEGEDYHDGGPSQLAIDEERKRVTLEQLKHKLDKTMKLINVEQNAKEDHVNEYLRLSNNADKQQRQRIKAIFEKKNQKSTQIVSQFQKKVEGYKKKIAEVELYGVSTHKQPKEVLKDVGQGLKGFFARDTTSSSAVIRSRDSSPSNIARDMGANIKEFSGGVVDNIRGARETIVSKPKELAHGLFRNKKYGSADNIHNIKLEESQGSTDDGDKRSQHGSGILPANRYHMEYPSEEDGGSDVTSESAPSAAHSSPHATLQISGTASHFEELRLGQYFEHISKELEDQRELNISLQRAIHELKTDMKEQLAQLNHSLEEERYRRERLEEQINDLTELHQNEVPNIRQDLASMEEKMEYKLEERTLDLHELLESCQTRISKMEMQQQQQQLISMEGIDNSNFRALIVKLLNVVLALVGVVLVFVSTLANVLGPFLTTRLRILSTIALIACIVAVWQNWQTVRGYSSHLYEQYGHILPMR